jgi:glycine/D-amino acid oxidase-like deaminating enzyme
MTKTLQLINTESTLPAATTVVIIGGGIVGVSAALSLAERNIPVVLLEKGHIAGEQSSRNLGWIRKTSRHIDDIPLAIAADQLWADMAKRVGKDVGYKQTGIMFLAQNEAQLATHEAWLESVKSLSLGSKMLSAQEINEYAPRGAGSWAGGVYTPSDGKAEPHLAATAIANAAINRGAKIIQNCAVRSVITAGGKVSGVMTEQGEIRCEQVLLAGGVWSRRFLGNLGISYPTLPLICSALRTKPLDGPTDIAIGGPNFSFRKHDDGGYIITQRARLEAPLSLDHLLVGHRYLKQLRTQGGALDVSLSRYFLDDLALKRKWRNDQISPFEKVRTLNPEANQSIVNEALTNLREVWPLFEEVEIAETWAGLMDITPDSNPVIDRIDAVDGLTVAIGFSGHGFGTGPAAGALAADLVTNASPLVNPSVYRFDRF